MRAATYMMGAERKVQRTSEAAIYVGGGKEQSFSGYKNFGA